MAGLPRDKDMEKTTPKISNLKKACFLSIDEFTHGLFDDPHFRAPEVIKGRQYNMKADSWSFGVILF